MKKQLVLLIMIAVVDLVVKPKDILIIGHRGAMGHEPENTLKSFDRAIKQGADMIEFDVQLCKSGEPVIFHDPTLEKLTGKSGTIASQTLDELRDLRVDGEQIPTLDELLKHVNKRTKLNIEIKDPHATDKVIKRVKKLVAEEGWRLSDIIITSNNYQAIEEVKNRFPEVTTGAIFIAIPMIYQALRARSFGTLLSAVFKYVVEGASVGSAFYIPLAEKVNADVIVMNRTRVTPEIIDNAHKHGLEVYPYVVNEPEDIKTMVDSGVDGIISNYPDRVSAFLNKK